MSDFDFMSNLPDEFKFKKKNELDHSKFRDFQREHAKRISRFEKDTQRESRIANLRLWDKITTERWRGSSLKKLDNQDIAESISEDFKTGIHSFFLIGAGNSEKTAAGHAIFRRGIGSGKINPTRVKFLPEYDILQWANSGFAGKDKLNKLMEYPFEGIILDSVDSSDYNEREITALEGLIEKCYSHSIPLVVTSTVTPGEWGSNFSQSIFYKLKELFASRIYKFESEDIVNGDPNWDTEIETDEFSKYDG